MAGFIEGGVCRCVCVYVCMWVCLYVGVYVCMYVGGWVLYIGGVYGI